MLINTIKNIGLVSATDVEVEDVVSNVKTVKSPTIEYKRARRPVTNDYEQLEYDLTKILQLANVDGYLQQSFNKKKSLLMKEGYDFVGKNQENVEYVKRRLSQIALASGISTNQLIERIGSNIVQYNNCVLLKVRNFKSSNGFKRRISGRKALIDPVAAYFVAPMPTMQVRSDDDGHVLGWRQYVANSKNRYREFSPENTIHIHRNKEEGFAIAMPQCWPVIADIDALRHMEENIEMLVHQTLFPVIHYRVGTDERPARNNPNGINEVDEVAMQVEHMPPEGIYVTSERHEIKMIGSEGRALRAESYLLHFKKRVFAGLAMSSVDFGEGDSSNRSTAETMSRSLIDEIKSIQSTIEEFFNNEIISELLLESGREIDILDEDERVYLVFREIDTDSKIKKENHVIQKWIQNLISVDEARIEMGYEVMDDETWKRTHHSMITVSEQLLNMSANPQSPGAYAASSHPDVPVSSSDINKAVAVAKQLGKASQAGSGSSAASKSRRNQTVSNRNRPQNQHGTKMGSSASLKDCLIFDNEIRDIKHDLNYYYSPGKSSPAKTVISFYRDTVKEKMIREVRDSFNEQFSLYGSFVNNESILVAKRETEKIAGFYVDKLFKDIEDICCKNKDLTEITDAIDNIAYRLDFIRRTEKMRARNWAKLQILKLTGKTEYKIKVSDNTTKEEKEKAKLTYPVNDATIYSIPPFHVNCTAEIIIDEE